MFVDDEDFLLVGGELFGVALWCRMYVSIGGSKWLSVCENEQRLIGRTLNATRYCVCFAHYAHGD